MPASIKLTLEFGSAPNWVEALENSLDFELFLDEVDLVSDYSIQKFDKEFIFYEILFNGTVKNFINIMNNKNYNLNTEKKIWMIE